MILGIIGLVFEVKIVSFSWFKGLGRDSVLVEPQPLKTWGVWNWRHAAACAGYFEAGPRVEPGAAA